MAKSQFQKKEFVAGKDKYKVTLKLLDGDQAYDHFFLLLDVLSPFFGGMMDQANKDEAIDIYHKPSFWKDSFVEISKKLRDPAMKEMFSDMLEGSSCDGESVSLSHEMFRGNISLMVEVFIWCIMENFGEDLLGKLDISKLSSMIPTMEKPTGEIE